LLKFILPALETACSSSLVSRALSLFNTRSNLLKAGACFKVTNLVQYLQCIIFYGSMGMNLSSKDFVCYFHKLLECPLILAEFFPLEPSTTAGLFGFRFCLFRLAKLNIKFLSTILNNDFNPNQFETEAMQDERLMSLSLDMGQRKRHFKFLKEMNINHEDIEKKLKEKPDLLYRQPITNEEALLLVQVKATSPQMADSLAFLNFAKIHRASVYIIHHGCLTLVKNEKGETISEKISLLEMIKKAEETISKDKYSETEKMDRLNEIFPEYIDFNMFMEICSTEHADNLEYCSKERNLFTKIPIRKTGNTRTL